MFKQVIIPFPIGFLLVIDKSIIPFVAALEIKLKCGVSPLITHPNAIKVIGKYFDYSAIHEDHNHGISWKCKTFFGCDGINETDSVNLHDDRFMFQSHIAGDWNQNIWNEDNYENFRNVLKFLLGQYEIKFKTLKELL